jgi:hypothetical protein
MIMMGRGRPKHPQSNAANNPFWGTGGMDNGHCGNVDGHGNNIQIMYINLSIYVNIFHTSGKKAWMGIGETNKLDLIKK